MAYGITAAGKTYTIEGTSESPGLIPRALGRLFDLLQQQEQQQQQRFEIEVSYCEIYNESIFDLLVESQQSQHNKQPHHHNNPPKIPLRLVDASGSEGRVEVAGLVRVRIESVEQGLAALQRGSRARARAETGLNLSSSRSHSIFTITLRDNGDVSSLSPCADTNKRCLSRRLAFVDLAGSERVQRTGNIGVRLKESVAINASLMTLGRCLEALAWNQQQQKQQRVVPYRESKVTHLFRDALHGYGTVVLSVNVSPAAKDYDETVHVLRYASLATGIETTTSVDPMKNAPFKKKVTKPDKAPRLLRRQLLKARASEGNRKRRIKDQESIDKGRKHQVVDQVEDEVSKKRKSGCFATPASQDLDVDLDLDLDLDSDQNQQQHRPKLEELQAQIQQLLKDLQAAEEKTVLVEAEVREEVASEMAELLRDMESRYKERVTMEVAAAEGRLEARIKNTEQRLQETEEALAFAQRKLDSQERELECRIQEELTQREANAAMELGMAEQEVERLRKEVVSLKGQLSMATSALEAATGSPSVPFLGLTSGGRFANNGSATQDAFGNGGGGGATPHEIALHRALRALHAVDAVDGAVKDDGKESGKKPRGRSRLAKSTTVAETDMGQMENLNQNQNQIRKPNSKKNRSKLPSRKCKKIISNPLEENEETATDGGEEVKKEFSKSNAELLLDVGSIKSVEPKSVKRRLLGVSRVGLEIENNLYSPFVHASPYSREGRL